MTATDRGVPPRSATNTATATITVVYNTAPYFDKEVYMANVSRDITENSPIATYTASDNDIDVSILNISSTTFYFVAIFLYLWLW